MAALTLVLALCYSLCDPSPCLKCSLSLGLLLSNDALLLCCFCKSPLFIQFCRRLLPYGSKPPLPSNSHLLRRPRCDANSSSGICKAEWQSGDIFICRTHFFFVIRLQLEREQNCSLVSFPFIASYCNEVELEEEGRCGGACGGGAGAVHTLGNIKTDSAPCALIKKTIKSDHKPVFNTLPVFLSSGFTHYWLVLQLEPQRRSQAGLAWTTLPKWGKR